MACCHSTACHCDFFTSSARRGCFGVLCVALVRNEAWAGTYGNGPGSGPRPLPTLRSICVWGNNATVANLHLVRKIWEAKRKGGRLVVIDPLRTKIAEQADLHLTLKPGTDVLLGFALAVELERLGAHNQAFIANHVSGYDEYMAVARQWSADSVAEISGVPAVPSAPRRLDGGSGPARDRARKRAGARPQWRQRYSGGDRSACPDGKTGAGASGIVLGARNAFPETAEKLTRPDLVSTRHPDTQHQGYRPSSGARRH